MPRLAPLALVLAVVVAPTGAAAGPLPCPLPGVTDRCADWSMVVDHEAGHAGGMGTDALVASAGSPDGATVYAAGYSQSASGDLDAILIATVAATGEERWSVRRAGEAGLTDTFVDLALSLDGSRIYATGGVDVDAVAGVGDYLVAAFDASTGAELWTTIYDHQGLDLVQAIAVGPAGADAPPGGDIVYVTGQSDGDGMDAATLAIDGADGSVRWVDRFAEATGLLPWDSAFGVGVEPGGDRVYIAGSTFDADTGRFDGLVVAYESGLLEGEEGAAGGRRAWVRRVERSSLVRVAALDGAVIAAGKAWRAPSPAGGFEASDMLTVGLGPDDGSVVWLDRLTGSGPTMGESFATALATGEDPPRAYVAGVVSGPLEGDDDMAVVAYDANTGGRAWTAGYATPGHLGDAPLDLLETDGRVVVTGVSAPTLERPRMFSTPTVAVPLSGEPPRADAVTFALDADGGDRLWSARFNPSDAGSDFSYGWSVAPAAERVVVAGFTGRVARAQDVGASGPNRYDGILVAYGLD